MPLLLKIFCKPTNDLILLQITGNPSFVFLWCGSEEGLDEGRECLRRWGFRRCEDLCWIKTNKNRPGNTTYLEPKALFQHTKEHCLMGIKVGRPARASQHCAKLIFNSTRLKSSSSLAQPHPRKQAVIVRQQQRDGHALNQLIH